MTIDETTRKLEAEQKPRQSAIKKIVSAGLIMLSLGLYHPTNASAQDVGAGAENGKTGAYVTPGGSVGNNVVLPGGGSVGMTRDGKVVVVPRNNKTDYQRRINEYDAAIARDPANAKLYIAKADEMIRNKAPPQEIANNLKLALQYAKGEERVKIHYGLGNEYLQMAKEKNTLKDYNESLFHFEQVKKLNPRYQYINEIISQVKQKVK